MSLWHIQGSLWENKWAGLAAAVYAEACSGLSYTFSIYSDHLKETLGYTQTQIDVLSSVKGFGGNTGLLTGLVFDLMPPWVSVFIGGTVNMLGYSGLYLVASKALSVPYWLVCMFILLGANSVTWVDTAVLVTSMQTFPNERGLVAGLMKAYVGLSGAIFTRVYKSFIEPHASVFILLQALSPFLVFTAVMSFIRPYPNRGGQDSADVSRRLRWSYGIVIILASYLMFTIILEEVVSVGRPAAAALTIVMLTILILPALVPLIGGSHKATSEEYGEVMVNRPSLQGIRDVPSTEQDHASLEEEEFELLMRSPSLVKETRSPGELTWKECMRSLNFWLLFTQFGAGTGCGLAVIDNFSQMGKALGSGNISSYIALFSIWNCAGRLVAGYGSEWCVQALGFPRTMVLVLATCLMGAAQLLLATGSALMLFVGSILVGFSHGAIWALTPAITAELFGLHHFGAIYNTLTMSSPIAAYVLSTRVAGYLYDQQVQRQHQSGGPGAPSDRTCLGPDCFQLTLLILAFVCGCAVLCGITLNSRTRASYPLTTTPEPLDN